MKKIILMVFFVLGLALMGCTSSSDSPAVSVTDDDFKSISESGFTFQWQVDGDNLKVRLKHATGGWVACGFATGDTGTMSNANIIMGYIDDTTNEAVIEDRNSFGMTSAQALDTTNNVTINTEESSQDATGTQISFSIPLNSGDDKDLVLVPGTTYDLLLAAGSDTSDNFSDQHSGSDRVRVSISL